MSLKRNILANYASQLYLTVAGILMVPLYMRYMGAEAYGLVGFFAMLQAFFNLLDMGLTPTMARESARFHGGAISLLEYRRLTRALEGIFATIALLGGLLMITLAEPMASRWLKISQLQQQDITLALQLMAIIIALRWMCGLYRGVITGAERLIWLSGFNSLITTGRFVLVLPVLMFVSATPQTFFTFQLAVALLEILGMSWMAYCLLPDIPTGLNIRWEWAPIKHILRFSISIALTSSVWVLVTQTDKLVLSKILSLADYGYFTVAILVASGIVTLSSPIISALMPRMARLQAEGKHTELIAVYRLATQLVLVIAVPIGLILSLFSKQVLWEWTGDITVVEKSSPVLTLYAVGNSILAISSLPYCLQYAKGNLRLHIIGSLLFLIFMIPSVIFAAYYHGMSGVGWVWLTANSIYFIGWVPIVHGKLAPGIHMDWIKRDIIKPALLPLLFSFLIYDFIPPFQSRTSIGLMLITAGLFFVFISTVFADRLKFSRILSKESF